MKSLLKWGFLWVVGYHLTWGQEIFQVEKYSRNYSFENPYSKLSVPEKELVNERKERSILNRIPEKPKYHIQDSEVIQSMVKRHIAKNKRTPYVMGYRLLLYSSTNRNEILKHEQLWLRMYPEIETQIEFERPHFKLYAGRYYSLFEAQRQLAIIQKFFPRAIAVPAKLPKPIFSENP